MSKLKTVVSILNTTDYTSVHHIKMFNNFKSDKDCYGICKT
ncbi:MAG: hypothetical protein Gaeavirus7_6 [Gaeavirus sp.]|uniref:Uncharacterized protein n=1 Tax=Gaeavirus sp. TaxID=2487767 RepID=A0A3G5A3L4_9VIRU|nr:MAG: hypothetical protein Gaeavirus7_6 [Gaeavirus sp.]